MAMVLDANFESEFPHWASVRRRFRPDSPFFASGNIERELLAKQVLFPDFLFLFEAFFLIFCFLSNNHLIYIFFQFTGCFGFQ